MIDTYYRKIFSGEIIPLYQHSFKKKLEEKVRINKYLSEVGFCSRRAADKLLAEGRITVNGEITELGTKVSAQDVIKVDGKSIQKSTEEPVYIAFNTFILQFLCCFFIAT